MEQLKSKISINEQINNEIIKNIKPTIVFNYSNIILNNYYLYNILSNEMLQIICNFNDLQKMIGYLLREKYANVNDITDDDFIDKFLNVMKKYVI